MQAAEMSHGRAKLLLSRRGCKRRARPARAGLALPFHTPWKWHNGFEHETRTSTRTIDQGSEAILGKIFAEKQNFERS